LPLYEYECKKCGKRFEKICKFSDPPLTKCENCGGKLEQLLSSPAIQFKGSGWYVTDYARKPQESSATSGGDTSAPAEKKETPSTKKTEPAKASPGKE